MGYEVGHGGFLWGVWLAVSRGGLWSVSWRVCGVARSGSQWWSNSRSALGGSEMSLCGCGSIFGGKKTCVSYL